MTDSQFAKLIATINFGIYCIVYALYRCKISESLHWEDLECPVITPTEENSA